MLALHVLRLCLPADDKVFPDAVSLIPSKYFLNNLRILTGKSFNPAKGFMNSLIISCGVCACSLYFSTLTAYALVMYEWKLKNAFFGFIMGIMMIPATVTIIGFFQMVYKVHMTNHLLVLILPAIASPSMVFFMRQYMKPAVSVSLVESALHQKKFTHRHWMKDYLKYLLKPEL